MAGALPPKSSERSYTHSNSPVLRRSVELAQYTSLAFTEELQDAGITGSIGSVGDALDNALRESTIGLFKTKVIEYERPVWESWRQVEQATASWVYWYNTERLHSSLGDIPPVEHEETYYDQTRGVSEPAAASHTALRKTQADSPPPPAAAD